jgi:hypothetical protein
MSRHTRGVLVKSVAPHIIPAASLQTSVDRETQKPHTPVGRGNETESNSFA